MLRLCTIVMATTLKSAMRWKGGGESLKSFKAEAQNLFNDETMAQLSAIPGMPAEAALSALQNDLVELCAHYRSIISTLPCDLPTAPFNLSLTKRIAWLEANVINPCERLRSAVSDEMRPMFSTWPYPLTPPVFRDNAALEAELDALNSQATELRDDLRGQQSGDAGHSQEIRQEIFSSIARVLRNRCPNLKLSRGVYDSELRRRNGAYPDAMRLIFKKVTGVEENLDRLIRGEIADPS